MKSLLKSLSLTAFSEAVFRGSNFLISIYLARKLGVDNFGLWAFYTTIFMYLNIINNFGLDMYGVKKIANGSEKSYVFTNVMVFKFLVYILIAFVSSFLMFFVLECDVHIYLLGFLLLALIGYDIASVWMAQGLEEFRLIASAKIIYSLVYVGFVIVAIDSSDDIVLLGLLFAISHFVLALFYIKPHLLKYFDLKQLDIKKWKPMLITGGVLFLSILFAGAYANIDRVMIMGFLGDRSLGEYEAAFKIYSLVVMFVQLLWIVFAPKIAKKESKSLLLFAGIILYFSIIFSTIIIFYGDN
ncbi:MAG: oligosaccharide flippase family protein, partial [Campylobacterales bacterium]